MNKFKLEKTSNLELEIRCKELLSKKSQEEIESSLLSEDLNSTKIELGRLRENLEYGEEQSRMDRRKAAESDRINDQYKFTIALYEKEIQDLKINLSNLLEKTNQERSEVVDNYESRLREKNAQLEKCLSELTHYKSLLEQLKSRENALLVE